MSEQSTNEEQKLTWWQLSLIGIGSTIGTGYFLGSVIAIQRTGQGVIFAYLVAGIGTFFVFSALAQMAAEDPQEGSFRTYARKAFGREAGFATGWIYWISEMLIMGSQLTALSLLTKFWFPDAPLWIFTLGYGILGILVLLIGTRGFEKSQNVFAIIKIAALLMFLILASLVLFGFFGGSRTDFSLPRAQSDFLPQGITGLWSGLIFGFYAFGGIEIMGMMSPRLRRKEDIFKAGTVMVITLTVIYMLSFFMATGLAAREDFSTKESPFITALSDYNIKFFPHFFTGGIIIAGFSTLAASLFAVTVMVETLAKDGDAPELFARRTKLKVSPYALLLTAGGLAVSIFFSFIIPDRVYEYVTAAASLIILYIWIGIVVTAKKLRPEKNRSWWKVYPGIGLLLVAIIGSTLQRESRHGFFISLLFLLAIFLLMLIRRFVENRKGRRPDLKWS